MKCRSRLKAVVANAKLTKSDPTRTLSIRRAFSHRLRLAFAQLKGRIAKEFGGGGRFAAVQNAAADQPRDEHGRFTKEEAAKEGFLYHGMSESGYKEFMESKGFEQGGFSDVPQKLYGPRYIAIREKDMPTPDYKQGRSNVQISAKEGFKGSIPLRSEADVKYYGNQVYALPHHHFYEADEHGNILGRLKGPTDNANPNHDEQGRFASSKVKVLNSADQPRDEHGRWTSETETRGDHLVSSHPLALPKEYEERGEYHRDVAKAFVQVIGQGSKAEMVNRIDNGIDELKSLTPSGKLKEAVHDIHVYHAVDDNGDRQYFRTEPMKGEKPSIHLHVQDNRSEAGVFYTGTHSGNNTILSEGLRSPKDRGLQKGDDLGISERVRTHAHESVYLTPDRSWAETYAKMGADDNGTAPMLLKVKIPKEHRHKVMPDEEATASYSRRYEGSIPPEWIQRVDNTNPNHDELGRFASGYGGPFKRKANGQIAFTPKQRREYASLGTDAERDRYVGIGHPGSYQGAPLLSGRTEGGGSGAELHDSILHHVSQSDRHLGLDLKELHSKLPQGTSVQDMHGALLDLRSQGRLRLGEVTRASTPESPTLLHSEWTIKEYPDRHGGWMSQKGYALPVTNVSPEGRLRWLLDLAANFDPEQPRGPDGRWGFGSALRAARATRDRFAAELDRVTDMPVLRSVKAGLAAAKGIQERLTASLRERYGPAATVAILASGQAIGWGAAGVGLATTGVPLILPGASLWGAIPGVALAEGVLQATRLWRKAKAALVGNVDLTLSNEQVRAAAVQYLRDFAGEWRRHLTLEHGDELADAIVRIGTAPTENDAHSAPAWAGSSSRERLEGFQEWLRQQLGELAVGKTQEQLWRAYIHQGFKKGAGRAFDDLNRARPQFTPEQQQFYAGSRDGFLRSSFAQPVAKERVELLAARTFDEMENVTTDMANRLSRTLADGMVRGKGADEVARDLADAVDVSRARAEVVARTELIRAHAEGQLTALEQLGVTQVGVEVEWQATADGLTCPLCSDLEGTVLSIEEARGMLPRHPNCRCCWVPSVPEEEGK